MRKLLIYTLIATMTVLNMHAQSVTGDWEGELEVQGTTLKIIFHVVETDEVYSSTMDSPNQGALGIEMDETVVQGQTLTIKKAQMSMETILEYDAENDMLSGVFNQGPMKLPLKLNRSGLQDKPAPSNNHPMAGDWNTELDLMGTQLRLIFHITENEGVLSTTLDSPDQSAYGMATDYTTVDGNDLAINAKAMGITVNGTYVPDSNLINAKFLQGPVNQKITMRREAIEKKTAVRPQEPLTFDYMVEEVKFVNPDGGHELAGTLTIPKRGKFEKVVVLVTGSGPQDRNEELLGHKPFLVLSDHLTRNGVAVLRYDDRGVGESKGDFASATSMDFAEDAASAVEYLRTRADMKDKSMGIMGHSEGGMIAPIVAGLTEMEFIVLLAGPGMNLVDLLLEQTEAISRAAGVPDDEIDISLSSSRKIFDYMKANQSKKTEELVEPMTEILRGEFKRLSKEQMEEVGDVETAIAGQIRTVTTPWFRYFIGFEPADYLKKVDIPVLAVNGSLDLQVLSKSNLAGIRKNLEEAGNTNYEIKEFEGMNHLFQRSADGSGSPSEYGKIEETFNAEALEFVTEWVINYDKK